MNNYEYGPNVDFNIKFIGDMKKYNGDYEKQNDKSKYLLQTLCHAIYEIKDDIKNSKNGILKLDEIWIHYLQLDKGEDYSIYTNDMMTAFHIIETAAYSFDFEFLSPSQLIKADSLLNYAYEHKLMKRKIK